MHATKTSVRHTATKIDKYSLVDGMLVRYVDKKTGNLVRGIFRGYFRSIINGLMAKIQTGEMTFKSRKLYSTTTVNLKYRYENGERVYYDDTNYDDDMDGHNWDYFNVPVIENVELDRICQYR